MNKQSTVGIDVSMNSTGLTFITYNDLDERILKFIRIAPSTDGKQTSSARLVTYVRDYRKLNYSHQDLATVNSAKTLASTVSRLITEFCQTYKIEQIDARIEGSIMSKGFKKHEAKVNDLTVFNGTMKLMLLSNKFVNAISVIAPGSLKKYATGKGNCTKDKIVAQFKLEFPDFDCTGKIDDIADSYYLASAKHPEKLKYFKSIEVQQQVS